MAPKARHKGMTRLLERTMLDSLLAWGMGLLYPILRTEGREVCHVCVTSSSTRECRSSFARMTASIQAPEPSEDRSGTDPCLEPADSDNVMNESDQPPGTNSLPARTASRVRSAIAIDLPPRFSERFR